MSLDEVELGRAAFLRHAWLEAVEALRSAERQGPLSDDDLDRLAEAEWWAGNPDDSADAMERAFARRTDAGDVPGAAGTAMRLAYLGFRRLALPVAAGWMARAEELLQAEPESAAHAWLAVFHLLTALGEGRLDDAARHGDEAMSIARRHGDPSALALAQSFTAMVEMAQGRWQEGIELSDRAAAAAMSGGLDLRVASDIWCQTISMCRDTGDLQRATLWTDQAERWMRREAVGGYPGVCQVHRAELKMLRGDWAAAELEARHACEELERFRLMDSLGYAHYAVGEVRLRMGDLATATEELDRAYELGHEAQPAAALTEMVTGDHDEAAREIERALAAHAGAGGPKDRVGRMRLLPAQVEIALARHDIQTARRAVEELDEIASSLDRPYFRAAATTADGAVLLQDGQPGAAAEVLGRAWRMWHDIGLPYESAAARVTYAQALSAGGDDVAALRDLRAARGAFERLGANRDLARIDRLVAAIDARAIGPIQRATKAFMFTDIVTSTDLVSLIGDEAWEDLLRWHDRELGRLFKAHQGEIVEHTGDGFFVAFDQGTDGVACAVAIQRSLVAHRHEQGFAPWVRIGLHAAEATRHGSNYSGKGVHVAARIGAAAERDEILVSDSIASDPGMTRFALSPPRVISLKGVREPMDVRSVEWRAQDAPGR